MHQSLFPSFAELLKELRTPPLIIVGSSFVLLKIPEINLEVGQEYIEYLLDLEIVSNNLIYLAAAYNGGPGNLKKWKKETNYLDDPLFFMESIPSRETRWFIEKILTKYWIYQNKNQKEMKSLKMLANGEDPLY